MPKHAKPILDTETGREYSSMYKAGQDLAGLVHGDPKDSRVWFAIQRAFPNRFQTKDPVTGQWVPLNRPARKPQAKKELAQASPANATTPTVPDSEIRSLQDKPRVVAAADTNRAVSTKGTSVKTTTKTPPSKSKRAKAAPKKRSPKPSEPATKSSRKA